MLPQQTVLILEDYHLVADPAIHASVIFFVDHLPLHLHLVLSSRVDPPFPLARWRVQRQLLEIRTADLRFRQQEATRFLKETMGLPLSQEEITTLEQRTEGWIAGLQMAALALQKREDRFRFVQTFGGRHHYLLDYVQQEILAHLPQALQDFLLQIAVPNRLNATLCRAVTEEPASQKLLETVERANLFLIPLDEERCWYRFHDLFREALLAHLHAHWPERVSELHIRAACWYEAQGYIHEAVTHALAAADYPLAASFIERAAEPLWLSGEASTVFTWTMSLSDTALSKHASLALNAALRLLESIYWSTETFRISMQALVLQGLARVEALLHQQQKLALPQEEQELVLRRLHLLRGWIVSREMVWQINREGLQHLVQQMQELAREEEMNWKMIPFSLETTLISLLRREGTLLIPLLSKAKEQASLMGNHLITLSMMRQLAAAYARAGQLHQAYQECLTGLALAEQTGAQTPSTGYLYYYLAWVYSDWNRQEEANHAIQKMLHISQLFQQKDMLIAGATFFSQLSLEAGDLATAQQTLQLAEELVQGQEKVAHLYWVTATRVRYWLATGNLEAARDWAAHMIFELQAWDSIQIGSFLSLIRVYLAQGQYRQAMALLRRFRTKFDRPGDISTAIEFLALQVVGLYLLKKAAEARKVAVHLLHLTEPHGNIRIYVHAGEPMKQVLESLLKSQRDDEAALPGISTAYICTLLKAFEQEKSRVVPASQQPPGQPARKTWTMPSSALASWTLVEPLSVQEQHVLRLLTLGHTNPEIASMMVISVNTVKTHVQHIYRKLGIHNRVQACQLVRRSLLL
jgi:LuxR family maltose regulon positive regulatory protein